LDLRESDSSEGFEGDQKNRSTIREAYKMAFGVRGMSLDAACNDKITDGVELCPFLRNIGVATSFSFSSFKFPVPAPVSFWYLLHMYFFPPSAAAALKP
jgi:hypothetical protein